MVYIGYMVLRVQILTELTQVQLEIMGLNLRQLCDANEISTVPCNQTSATNFTIHKLEGLADIHSELELLGDSLGPSSVFSDRVDNAASIRKCL
jgi:hypothetical protein